MLLRLLGEALTRAHRLPASEGLTASAHRAPRASSRRPPIETTLAQVAAVTADAVRYAPRAPPNETLEAAVAHARTLLGQVRMRRRSGADA